MLIETWRDGRRDDLRLVRCDARPAGALSDRLADDEEAGAADRRAG